MDLKLLTYLLFFFLPISTTLAQGNNWKSFELRDLSSQRMDSDRPYFRFLDENSMSMGLYALSTTSDDRQQPHDKDEIYYVVSGSATLVVGDERLEAKAGSVIYVKAEIPHRFIDITKDIEVLVIFSNTHFNPKDKDWIILDKEEIIASRKASENTWNPFIDVSTLTIGLYMLPERLGGDQTLTHKVDEVNIVVNGKAKFKMGDEEIDVEPGSIVWVKEGIGHYFHSLEGDFDVLILFEKRI